MTIATVQQGRRSLTIHLGELAQRTPGGEGTERYRTLWAQERKSGRTEVLLGGPGQQIAAGVKGLERCIRVVVDRYGRAEEGRELEFDLHEMRNLKERRRLLGMAGGLLAGTRMSSEKKKERAMKAAMARYAEPGAFEEVACDGSIVKCWTEHVGSRHWIVTCTLDGAEVFRSDCKSRREVEAQYGSAKLVVEFKKFLQEHDNGAQ